MRLNIDCSNAREAAIVLDVEPSMKIDDVIALITVQNNHLEYNRIQLLFNGKVMKTSAKL